MTLRLIFLIPSSISFRCIIFPEENVLSFFDSYHKCHLEFLSILDLDFKQDLSASFTVWIYILEGERVCIKIESSFMGVTSK